MTSQASSSATSSKNIPNLVKEIKGFPLKVKAFQNTATYQKLRGGVPSSHPPPPLVPRWGYEFACTSEVKLQLTLFSLTSRVGAFFDFQATLKGRLEIQREVRRRRQQETAKVKGRTIWSLILCEKNVASC